MVPFNILNTVHQFSLNVLVVDDDFIHLTALGNVLTTLGYEVVKLQNAEHALATLKRKRRFDIIVCGISISEMGVLDLLQTADAEFNIPVILMDSNLNDKVALKGILSGATQCVAKLPVLDLQVLKNIWQHVVRRQRNKYVSCDYSHQNEHSSKVSENPSLLKVVGETISPTTYGGGPIYFNPTTFIETRNFVPATTYGGGGPKCCSNLATFIKTKSSIPAIRYGLGPSCSNPTTFIETRNPVSTTPYGEGGSNCFNPKGSLKIREERSEGFDHAHEHVSKKDRFIWTDENHQIFLDGMKYITLKAEKIVPKKLFNYMRNKGVLHITRENIASHLQKYRSNIKKLYSNGIGKSCDFPNSDVMTTELTLGKSCPSDDQTLSKTQNLASQELNKQEQETPSNETLHSDQTMQDIDWNTLEVIPTGFENSSICDQHQQVGQESNINFSLDFSHINNEKLDPSIESANQIIFGTNGNIIGSHDHPLRTDFNQNLDNGLLNEYVYNSQNFESFETNLTENDFQALSESLNSNKQVVIKGCFEAS